MSVPVISSVAVSSITSTTAIVTWTTDIASDSLVFHTPTEGGYISYGVTTPITDTGGVTSHSVTLTGLRPNVTYWYGVKSRNVANLSEYGIWEDSQATNTFTTSAAVTSGNYDFYVELRGGHTTIQGFDLVFCTISGDLTGTSDAIRGTWKLYLHDLPPNCSVSWPYSTPATGYTISTTTTPGDTVTCDSPFQGQTVQINTNVGGTTTPGTYTLTLTASNNSTSSGTVSHDYTWTMVVNDTTPLSTGTPSSYPAIPGKSTWESRMTHYGAMWVNSTGCPYDQKVWFYDGVWAYQRVRNYTGDSVTWSPAVTNILNDERNYIIGAGYNIGFLYKIFPDGLYNDYVLYGGALASKQAIIGVTGSGPGIANMSDFHSGYNIPIINMRECAYITSAKRYRDKLNGVVPQFDTKIGITVLLGMAEQVSNGTGHFESFMCGLLAETLIYYYQDGNSSDIRIPWAIKNLADYLYANAWNKYPVTQPGGFIYDKFRYDIGFDDTTGGNYQPTLNNLVAPMYAWLFQYTGSATYQTQGDDVFVHSDAADSTFNADGTLGYAGNGGKAWTQNYRWSFDYVTWRSALVPNGIASPTGVIGSSAVHTPNTSANSIISTIGVHGTSAIHAPIGRAGSTAITSGVASSSNFHAPSSSGDGMASPFGLRVQAAINLAIGITNSNISTSGVSATSGINAPTAVDSSNHIATPSGVSATGHVGSIVPTGTGKNQLIGGAFQDAFGHPLAGGLLTLQLSTKHAHSPSGLITSSVISIRLDANGNIGGSSFIWPNDQLLPVGTTYIVHIYSSKGQLVWGPAYVAVPSLPHPYDVGAW